MIDDIDDPITIENEGGELPVEDDPNIMEEPDTEERPA
jgi:hypothetical protein